MTTPMESEEKEWFVVWHRRHTAEYPVWCFPGPCPDGARDHIFGNCSGPYTKERAEEIVSECLPS
jgi:hypothetical protein